MISAIVLAAGTSSRFGRTKQLVEVGGTPMVQHAVDAAIDGGVDDIVVVLGHDAEAVRGALRLPPHARAVVNPDFELGQATSLAVGLEAAEPASEGAVILMADQPGIAGAHVRALMDAFVTDPAPIVRLRFRDGPGPALLSREVWDRARTLTGDAGARQLIAARPELVMEVFVDEDAPPDVDVPEDLGRSED
ncbi:MAG TPA: nucleotidyltransferase family protein [Actinomycetota bacterium]